MSEFIERMARAMHDAANPDDDYDRFVANNPNPKLYERMAIAVLPAMEQPSRKMTDAAQEVGIDMPPDEYWRAMITAELKPD